MAKFSNITKQLQSMLPQWMKMAKDQNSVGAQFLNVFGLEFEEIKKYLDEVLSNQYIDTANISQIDITYKLPLALPTVVDMDTIDTVVGVKLDVEYHIEIVDTLRDFYSAESTVNVCMIDRAEGLLYIRPQTNLINDDKLAPYEYVLINGTPQYDLILHHIWNAFDEFGLLLGVQRLYGERNQEYKNRILDVFISPGNATEQGIINGLSRELGLTKEEIQINEISDVAFKNTLLNEDGSPTTKFVQYVDQINRTLGFTWDNMSWGEAYWQSIENNNIGFDYLPHVWDATTAGWKEEDFQSGIGDANDLLVKAPQKLDNNRTFKYRVGVRGRRKDNKLVYPETTFKYKITAKGTIIDQKTKPESYKYTVVASERIPLYFVIRAFQQYYFTSTVDFTGTGYEFDSTLSPNLEIVDGNTMLSPKNRYTEIEVAMQSSNNNQTPVLNSLTVEWLDAAGATNNLVFDTQAHFDQNDASVNVTKTNVLSTATGSVELGYGTFYQVIDTENDFKDGTFVNTEVAPTGSIRLKPLGS